MREIKFAKPLITEEEKQEVMRIFDGSVWTHGPRVVEFERQFAIFLGGGVECIAVSSCWAALHLTYLALGVGVGDVVLVPALTHVATAHSVEITGAKPEFVDCFRRDGNVKWDRIDHLLDYIPNRCLKAISVVHFLGIPCNNIGDIAKEEGVSLVEDAALTSLVSMIGRTEFDICCYSFYPSKQISTMEGGMIVTPNPVLADRIRKMRGFGVDRAGGERSRPGIYDVISLGGNYRMTEMQAQLGLIQLQHVYEWHKRRIDNYLHLREFLPRLEFIGSPEQPTTYCASFFIPSGKNRNGIVDFLTESGIETTSMYPRSVPSFSYYANKYGYNPSTYPNAETVAAQTVAIPIGPHLNDDDMSYIIEKIKTAVGDV